MNPKHPICILFGGMSSEHEVSLLSAASVIRHAPWSKAQLVLIGIDKAGHWYLQAQDTVDKVRAGGVLTISPGTEVLAIPSRGLFTLVQGRLVPLEVDCIFPVLHGTNGEDGTIQGFLETIDLPYVGGGILGSALGMDKEKVKLVWKALGLPILDFWTLRVSQWTKESHQATFNQMKELLGLPLFVKPARGGSSVGISKATDLESFIRAVDLAFLYDTKILIEPGVNAREIEVAVTGNALATPWTVGEIVPSHEFYDYEAKYLDPEGAALLIPARLSPEMTSQVQSIAQRAYEAAEARGLARVDFFLDKDSGKLVINEINTLPGFTHVSMFPMMVEAGGKPYAELIDHLVTLGLEEYTIRKALVTTKN